jgi:hypothetical protein
MLEEEVVVGASYRAVVSSSASMVASKASSSSRTRMMAWMQLRASVAWRVAILSVTRYCKAVMASTAARLTAVVAIERAGAMEISDPKER